MLARGMRRYLGRGVARKGARSKASARGKVEAGVPRRLGVAGAADGVIFLKKGRDMAYKDSAFDGHGFMVALLLHQLYGCSSFVGKVCKTSRTLHTVVQKRMTH